jgi:hypothetical protein
MPADPVALPNSKLINPVHVGIAARLPLTSQSPDADFDGSPGFFTVDNDNGWYSFVLSCSYEILEVDYIWSNESIRDVKTKPAPGGIIAEIYHGCHVPKQVTQLDLNLQDAMVQAAMEDNAEKLLKRWSDLYSSQVMSVVGAFLVPAPSLLEQVHESILVTEVAIPPLVLLIAAGLGYASFGIRVFISAWLATRADIADFPSIQGLADFAFRSPNGSTNSADAIEPLLRPVWVDYAIDSDQPSPETRGGRKVGIAKRAIGHALSVLLADRRPS